ncbi:MAG: OsmC family protein [Dokdonella sp.]|uniref:OsmC family protein n=1 Tax=Dokdonella sp. TaxID=2291710 RepID=UPI0027B9FF28|nr:OsmC family protein [Dokdonella sp.]MCW5577877.1 OsmC family protein [Dokdonella sp.]
MADNDEIQLVLEQEGPYAFKVSFGQSGLASLHTDEPAPLGGGSGPNPSALLLAGVANCLAASLVFALRKFHNEPAPIRAQISARKERNAQGRWRIARAQVTLTLADKAAQLEHFERVLAQFEQFCIVTQSVREGIAVDVRVVDGDGVAHVPGAAA